MQLSRLSRTVTSWIASIAILMSALAPAISQAAYRASGDPQWLEICTVYGMERVLQEREPAPSGETDKGPGKLCVYCMLLVGALPVQFGPTSLPAPLAGKDVRGAFLPYVPRPLHAWAASRARAPPART